ncbi:DNA cytosine methyltransferase [Streptomyces sp. NBC_00439]|uniref:DNA cytosine methyltransferase n=1 Tax=Streptomyces sp. NBC_00439 TaxID=2903650 RepID=UPI002255E782|nr:DNA cytosine methyltransferase [Streptomyces sp. NBC_00439]MCX5100244.1 DNA cytosine methyltransferase [Streptomyces sp. NBC_00439]
MNALNRIRRILDQPAPDRVPGQLAIDDRPRIGSVCSGYGGLDMAVEAVFGGATAWVADVDPGASRILAHHLPQVPNLGDITTVDWTGVEPVDIYCGGYPCQPFSTAGRRKGTEDARHIWPHIAHSLRVLRPRLAVFENVAGHLSLGFDTVLSDLAALGFDADWCTLRASDIGAAHQRNRLFLLAWPADTGSPGLARRWAERTAPHRRRLPAPDTLDIGGDRSGARGAGRDEPAARRLAAAHTQGIGEREPADQAHSVSDRGDAREVPGGRGLRTAADDDRNGRKEQQRSEPGLGARGDSDGRSPRRWGPYGPAIERWEAVIGRPAPRPVDDLGRLNPPLVEWLMGLPAGHVTAVPGLSRTAQLKALGNGVVPQQAAHALGILLDRLTAGAPPARAA